jgi:hypothetical protein
MQSDLLGSERRIETAEYWHVRSRETRARSEEMVTTETQRLMLGLADDYERTAHIVEGMASIRRRSCISNGISLRAPTSTIAGIAGLAPTFITSCLPYRVPSQVERPPLHFRRWKYTGAYSNEDPRKALAIEQASEPR